MSYSIVIPSKTATNLVPCVEAIRKHEPEAQIIVVDDGIDLSFLPKPEWQPPVRFIRGEKPFVFSRNVNLGIREAGTDDVLILNDDALLETPGGFSKLAHVAELHPEFGVMSAATNLGGLQQQPRNIGLREVQRVVAFVCVYIPRRTIDAVGLLDERFTAYGWEDNDLCRRIRNAGLKLGVFDGCYVDHGSLRSTFRGDPRKGGDIEPGRRIYIAKWGGCN